MRKEVNDMRQMTLDEIKRCELEILKNFNSFCEENGLQISLAYGTLLGCIRHKGFIPWDDDIDVMMLRSDYDRLLSMKKKFEKAYPNLEFKYLGSKNYPFSFLKIVNTQTVVEEKSIEKRYTYGVWIDIFPLDVFPNEIKEHKKNKRKIDTLNKILVKSIIVPSKIGSNKINQSINKYILIPFAHFIAKFVNIPKETDKLSRKFSKIESRFVINYIWDSVDIVLDTNDIFPTIIKDFEGVEFPVPKNYSNVLTAFYGNTYMELPPENERNSHLANAYFLNKDLDINNE